jgi:hypothetical protein
MKMSVGDIAQIMAAASAAVGLLLVWWQVRRQTTQHFSDRILDLYHEFDTKEAREKRKFVYAEFPKLPNPTEEQIDIVRDVLSSMDRIAYQVIRGYADPKAAYDLYGRVLTRIVFSAWKWLQEERGRRNDPPQFYFCRFAEKLALQYAREDLKAIGHWQRSHRKLLPRDLLQKAVEWSPPSTLAALEKQGED